MIFKNSRETLRIEIIACIIKRFKTLEDALKQYGYLFISDLEKKLKISRARMLPPSK